MDSAITRYYDLQPRHYAVMNNLVIRKSTIGTTELVLDLSARQESSQSLHLTFRGVTQLRLNSEGDFSEFSFLDIRSLRSDGWESINYRVTHEEQDLEFSFYCADFTADLDPTSVALANLFSTAAETGLMMGAQS